MRCILCLFIFFITLTSAYAGDMQNCVKGSNLHDRLKACNNALASEGISPMMRAVLHYRRARIYAKLGRHQKALKDFRLGQSHIQNADMQGEEIKRERYIAIADLNIAQSARSLGRLKQADEALWHALKIAQHIGDRALMTQISALGVTIQQEKKEQKNFKKDNRNTSPKLLPSHITRQEHAHLPTQPQIRNISGSTARQSGDVSYIQIIAIMLAVTGLSYLTVRFGLPVLKPYLPISSQSKFSPHEHSETIMSQTQTTTFEDFAPPDANASNMTSQKVGGMQPTFDVSDMQLHLRREQKRSISGTVTYTLHLFVEMSEEAKHAIKYYGFGNEIIYTKKPVIQAESLWAKLNPWKWAMHIAWWFLTRKLHSVRVKELVTGKTLKCKDIFEMVEIEDQIFQSMKNFGRIMYTASHFGGEEIFNIDHEIGISHAHVA